MEKLHNFGADAQIEFAQEMMLLDTLRIEEQITEMTERLLESYLTYQSRSTGTQPWVSTIARAPTSGYASGPPPMAVAFDEWTIKLYPFFKPDEAKFMIEYQLRAQLGGGHVPVMD